MNKDINGKWQGKRHLYGRRIGRPLSPALAELMEIKLPRLRLDLEAPAPTALGELFPGQVEDVWLEVGFGNGEHLLFQAERHGDIGFIGCEPFVTGVAKLLYGIEERQLGNIRLHDNDAHDVLEWLPGGSIGRAFVLFPDPWPKKRHRKRRFLTAEGLGRLARVMRTGAELRFATDIPDYAEMVLAGLEVSQDFRADPGRLEERPEGWPLTRYAEKAISAGRSCEFFIFTRN